MTTIIQEGVEQVKTLNKLYEFFGTRSRSLQIYCIGFGYGGIERFLHEQTGSPVKIFECRPEELARAEAFTEYFKERKETSFEWLQAHTRSSASSSAFLFHKGIPSLLEGTNIRVKGCDGKFQLTPFDTDRIDILKIDMKEATEFFIYQILHTGYRPGLLYIRWDRHPDKFSDSMICAGHIQMVGYKLLFQEGPWFVYQYQDDCMYEYCSWARVDCNNPFLDAHEEIIRTKMLAGTK